MTSAWKSHAGVLCFAAMACIAGGCGSGGGSGPTASDFSVSADTAGPTTLGKQVTFHVHLTSTGLSTAVTLSVTGAPASWTVTPPASPVALTANGQATADVLVVVPSNAAPAVAGQTLTVHADAPSHTHTANTLVTVANQFIIPIQRGALSSTHWGSLGNTTIHLNSGTLLTFRNDDTTSHNIHTGSALPGVQHQNTSATTLPGGTYDQTPTGTGSTKVTCHSHLSDSLTVAVP
jgi:hypothetical protein